MVEIRVLQDINKTLLLQKCRLNENYVAYLLGCYFNMRDKPNWILYVMFFNLIVDFLLALYTNLKSPVCP